MRKSPSERLAKVELNHITFNVRCMCGKDFKAEEFEPECPYFDRKYVVKIKANPRKIEIEIEPFTDV